MNFYKNNQNGAILKIMNILKNFYSRFKANYPKYHCSHSILKNAIQFYSHLLKDLKDLSPILKSVRSISKTKMLIYQSKANLDDKILFRIITDLLDPKIKKMLVRGLNRSENSTFYSGHPGRAETAQNDVIEQSEIRNLR